MKNCIFEFREKVKAGRERCPLCLDCFMIGSSGVISIDSERVRCPERLADCLACERESILSPTSTPELILHLEEIEDSDSDLFLMGVALYLMLSRVENKKYPFNWSVPVSIYVETVRNGLDIIAALERCDLSFEMNELLRRLLSFDISIRRSSIDKF